MSRSVYTLECAPEQGTAPVIEHNPEDLMAIFDGLFAHRHNTRLIRGDGEPVYLPASDRCQFHQVVFAHGYFASALHEIAHWCIAGEQRRQQLDYGYWYAADGRTGTQQQAFEKVEVKPQALEWIFSKSCDKPFRISVDNLNGIQSDPTPFKRAVFRQVQRYCTAGLPRRAAYFCRELVNFYRQSKQIKAGDFTADEIGLDAIESDRAELNWSDSKLTESSPGD